MDKVLIELKDVSLRYDDNRDVPIVDNVNLKIFENEFVTLLGPSGCGKTTTLRMIGGFLKPTSGLVIIDGKVFNDIPPYARPINTVFQRYALFPHLNVIDNVKVGLNSRSLDDLVSFFGGLDYIKSLIIEDRKKYNNEKLKISRFNISSKIKELIDVEAHKALEMVKLKGYEKRKIDNLSGGQMQRVAIARAVINRPKILLLDEPLAALDLKLRQNMQYELKEMQRALGITFIFVTHDQEEAMTMSDRIIVMNNGTIQQLGRPIDIYNEPVNAFVANFIGETNIFDGIYHSDGSVTFLDATYKSNKFDAFVDGEKCDVVIRPEDIMLIPVSNARLKGVVTSCIFKGVHYEICANFYDKEIVIHTLDQAEPGESIGIEVDYDDIHIMKVNEDE